MTALLERVAVDTDGYVEAADVFARGNRLAAEHAERLRRALQDLGAMAGDDSTSTEFASSYDRAAGEATAAYGEVVDAFGSLAVLTLACADNHRLAEQASTLGRGADHTESSPEPPAGLVRGGWWTPPTCLGGDDGDRPELWDLLVDHLEGFAWPNADTAALQRAATAWAEAATRLRLLPACCETGSDLLEAQRSPEIPLALDAVAELSRSIDDLAVSCDDLARSCRDYADDVEEHRDAIVGILTGLAVEVAVGLALSIASSFFTAGAGGAAGGAAIGARIADAARRVLTRLRALKGAATLGSATRLAPAAERLGPVRTALQRLARAHPTPDAADLRAVNAVDDIPAWRSLPRLKDFTWDTVVNYKTGPKTPMQHIKEGHWPDSSMPGKSYFSHDVTEEKLMDYVDEAVRRGKMNAADDAIIDCDLGRVIGSDRDGLTTTAIRVIIRDGSVHTAFPIPS